MSKLILKSNTGLKKKVQESIMDDGNEEYGSDALKRMLALAGVVSDDPASAAYDGEVIDTDAEIVDPELEDEDFTLSGENFHEGDVEDEDFDNELENDEDALIEYDPTDDIGGDAELIEDEDIDGSIDGVYDNEITDGELMDDATRFAIWRGWKECPDCTVETYAEDEGISVEDLMSIIDEYSHPYEKDFTVGEGRYGKSWMDELDGRLRNVSESHILDEEFDNGYLGEGAVDKIRAWNYDRLATRTDNEMQDVEDEMFGTSFSDPTRFDIENRWAEKMDKKNRRREKAAELRNQEWKNNNIHMVGESIYDDEDECDNDLRCIENGDRVKVRGEGGEIFTVSQCDGHRCWIGDENGAGWYIGTHRLERVLGEENSFKSHLSMHKDEDDLAMEEQIYDMYFVDHMSVDEIVDHVNISDDEVRDIIKSFENKKEIDESEEKSNEEMARWHSDAIGRGGKVSDTFHRKAFKKYTKLANEEKNKKEIDEEGAQAKERPTNSRYGSNPLAMPKVGQKKSDEDQIALDETDEELAECADYDYRLASRFGRKYEIDFNNNSIRPDGAAERERPTNSRYGSNALWYPGRGKPSSNDG
jgi:hypothetical protein